MNGIQVNQSALTFGVNSGLGQVASGTPAYHSRETMLQTIRMVKGGSEGFFVSAAVAITDTMYRSRKTPGDLCQTGSGPIAEGTSQFIGL